jgi:hypothetical protein
MDPRIPEFHGAVLRILAERVETYGKVAALLDTPSSFLTHDRIVEAVELLEADLPSPLRATLFDLGRLLSGALPTDAIAAPPPRLKVYAPEG